MRERVKAYYNEFDPKTAAWLEQLIKNGDIAHGVVDTRSITEVTRADLKGFTQCHFFAGIGIWSLALQNAGWPASRPIWTASLPCQPFSVAGNGEGKEDDRHLLPHFLDLVKECSPDTIIGEQVPAAVRHGWLDDLYDEMERENYAVGSVVLTAAGAGKPHIRQRIYWLADTHCVRPQGQGQGEVGRPRNTKAGANRQVNRVINDGRLGDSRLGNTQHDGHATSKKQRSHATPIQDSQTRQDNTSEPSGAGTSRTLPAEQIDWRYCRDNKYRPIKSGIAPLVTRDTGAVVHSSDPIEPNNSAEARAIRLKGYGNALCAPTAQLFIESIMCMEGL